MHIFHLLKNIYKHAYIVGFVIFFHVSCNCNPRSTSISSIKRPKDLSLNEKAKKIFIFNGLWQTINTFESTIQQLSETLRGQGLVVDIRAFQEPLTSKHSLKQQGLDAFEVVKEQVKDNPDCEIILIGHSQGGLRAAEILVLNEQAGRPLSIIGLITLGTPWDGAPAAGISREKIKKLLDEKSIHYFLKLVNHIDPASIQVTGNLFIQAFFNLYFPMHNPGVQDMVPHSPFLQQLATDIHAISGIPILAIGGVNENIHHFLKSASHTNKAYARYFKYLAKMPSKPLNMVYAHLFLGGRNVKNDWVVPLSSQLAEGYFYPFERCVIPGAIHDFIPFLNVFPQSVIYNHPVAVAQIEAFVKKHFSSN